MSEDDSSMEKVEPRVQGTEMIADTAIKADSPIRKKEEDLLGRNRMAARVAEVVNSSCGSENPCDESLVVGIEGGWGSGKTSFINLILENLKPEKPKLSKALIIEFNPWNFSDQNELVTNFFQSIVNGLESDKTLKGNPFETIRKIKRYFPKLLEQSSVSFGVPFLNIDLNLEGINGDPLKKQKEEIDRLLKKIGKTVLIVIDDIDRLDAQETRLVFKLVRMTANFANTVFILAYDRGKVGEMISEKGIRGEEFLKKIVQLPFPLPRVDQQDLFQILFGELEEIIGNFDEKHWDEKGRERWWNLFNFGLKRLFPTVRDIRRYVNSLRLDLEIVAAEEVNPVDFLGIEAIRVFAPDVYFAMAAEKRVFAFPAADIMHGMRDSIDAAAGWLPAIPGTLDSEARKGICEEIIGENSPPGLENSVREIVKQLFPQVRDLYPDEKHVDYAEGEWSNQLRVCSGDVFEKYFSLAVVSGILSEKEFKIFLERIDDYSASLKRLEKLQEDELWVLFERLYGSLSELDDQRLEKLLVVVLDFAENFEDRPFSLQSVNTRTHELARHVLGRIEKERRVEFMSKILDSTKSVYRSTWLVKEMNEEIRNSGEGSPHGEPPLSEGEVASLKRACTEKMKRAAKDGSLANNPKLAYVLARWKEWESREAVKDYVAKLLETDDGLFRFLRAYFSVDGEIIHKELIEEFVDIAELDERVGRFDEDSLDVDKAVTIRSYKNFPNRRRLPKR